MRYVSEEQRELRKLYVPYLKEDSLQERIVVLS